MNKKILFLLTIITSVCFGFSLRAIIDNKIVTKKKAKVTGIGGIFFKCKDTKKMNEWYNKNLGINAGKYGANFKWFKAEDSTKKGSTQWSLFADKTAYFNPSTKDFMINYRVENLEVLVENFKKDSVVVCDKIESSSYGKFVHIMNIEGNKIELWEPVD